MLIIRPTASINVPAIISTTAPFADNPKRLGWSIQNCGQNELFVNLGGTASTTVFHYILKKGTANDDGTGGLVSQYEGTVFTGPITIAGTNPRYVITELGA